MIIMMIIIIQAGVTPPAPNRGEHRQKSLEALER